MVEEEEEAGWWSGGGYMDGRDMATGGVIKAGRYLVVISEVGRVKRMSKACRYDVVKVRVKKSRDYDIRLFSLSPNSDNETKQKSPSPAFGNNHENVRTGFTHIAIFIPLKYRYHIRQGYNIPRQSGFAITCRTMPCHQSL